MFRLINQEAVLDLLGFKKSTLYSKRKEGSFPPPLSNTGTHSLWPDYEITQIQKAYILGKNIEQMKYLVERMIQERELGIIKNADVALP